MEPGRFNKFERFQLNDEGERERKAIGTGYVQYNKYNSSTTRMLLSPPPSSWQYSPASIAPSASPLVLVEPFEAVRALMSILHPAKWQVENRRSLYILDGSSAKFALQGVCCQKCSIYTFWPASVFNLSRAASQHVKDTRGIEPRETVNLMPRDETL